jgi:hypothetical protein
MSDDPLEAVRKLGQRLKEEAEKIGLQLELFAPIPDLDGRGSDRVQAIFVVDLDEMGKDSAERAIEDELDKFRQEMAHAEEEAKADEIVKQLQERSRKSAEDFLQ